MRNAKCVTSDPFQKGGIVAGNAFCNHGSLVKSSAVRKIRDHDCTVFSNHIT